MRERRNATHRHEQKNRTRQHVGEGVIHCSSDRAIASPGTQSSVRATTATHTHYGKGSLGNIHRLQHHHHRLCSSVQCPVFLASLFSVTCVSPPLHLIVASSSTPPPNSNKARRVRERDVRLDACACVPPTQRFIWWRGTLSVHSALCFATCPLHGWLVRGARGRCTRLRSFKGNTRSLSYHQAVLGRWRAAHPKSG